VARLERHLRKSPGEKSLGPTVGGAPRNLNPFTARDADLDMVVLEGIATVNFGRGVPDPTPGGAAETPSAPRLRSPLYATNEDFAVAAMSGPNRRPSISEEKDPGDVRNPDGHFPRQAGPMWRDTSFTALHLAPRERRGTSPASVNTYLHAEWTEPYWDAVRDDTGIWNSPPPPEMEVERAIYDAMKRETIEVGGYNVPFPQHPKESDYDQYTDSTGATVRHLTATRSFPFRNRENPRWTDGHPLYHATPTGALPRIVAEGLVAGTDRQLWFGASPTVWNEQFPHNAARQLKSPIKGMSFLRISPTQTMNERLSRLAKVSDVDRATVPGPLAIDSAGNLIGPRDSWAQIAVGLLSDALWFNDIKIPTENIEVLSQTGEWIPLYRTDLSDVVADPTSGPEAGMAKEKNRGIRRILASITNGKHGDDEGADEQKPASKPPAEVPVVAQIPNPEPRIKYSDSYGGDDLIKNEQRIVRIDHEGLVAAGRWKDIHGDHYDWWAYPIDRGSGQYGEAFNVAGEPLRRLREDPEFLASLAREIEIQALALGWSLYDQDWVEKLDWENGQDWRRAYPTRLWKATRSAQIFGLQREFESMLALHDSLAAGGVRFNHEDYWESPGTVDDVPSLGKSWKERQEEWRQRYPASDATSWTSPHRPLPQGPKRGSDDSQMTLLEEDRVWDAYDSYTTPIFPVVSDAEELADILSEPDEMIEFGYPYERIDKETRQLIADDIFFAVSLLMDGEFPDEEFTDRLESAEQMRRYADGQEGLYPEDRDILYALADALENPVSLYEDIGYESTDSPDGEAGMARRFRRLDEEPDYSDMSLSDTEIQNFIESEADEVTDDLIFGREVSRAFAQEEDEPIPRSVIPVRQISIPTLEEIPEDLKQSYIKLWAGGGSFVAINRQLGISNHDGAAIQTALLRSGEILPRTKRTSGDSLRLTPEDERVFVEWSNEGADMDLLTSVFGLTAGQTAEIAADLRSRGLIRRRFQKNFFTDSERDAFATIVKEELAKGRGIWPRSVLRAQRELGWSKQRAQAMLLWYKTQVKFGLMPGIKTQLSDSDMMRFAARWNDGVPEEQLAREFNVAEGSVKWLASKARKRGMRLKRRNSTDLSATDGLRRSPSLSREWLLGVENGTTSGGYQEFMEGMQKRAVALYRDGRTYGQIAKELGITGADAKYLVDRAATSGEKSPRRRGPKSKVAAALGITVDELVERMAARYNEGKTGAEMATEFGTTIGNLNHFLRVAGKRGLLKLRTRRPKTSVKRNVTGASSRKTRPIDGSDGEAGMSGPDSADLPDGIDGELEDHVYEDPVFGLSIKHPLFFWFAPITPEVVDLINASFAKKRASADEALRQKNWGRYIYLHERPYRIDAFEDVMDELTDQEYWSRLSDIWVDSENIGAQPDRWRNLLLSDRGSRESFMTEDERAEFAALQPRFTVYRGYSENDQEEFGMSWSTDAGVAEWFARRFAREDEKIFMEEMEVSKDDVFAYLTRRGEEEIILDMRTAAGGTASRRELPRKPKTRIPTRSRKLTPPDGEAGMSRTTERGDLVRLGRNSNYPSGLQPGSLGRVARVGRDGTISVEIEGELIKLTPGEDHFLVIPRQFDVLYELTDNDGNVIYLPVEDVTYPRLTSAREEAAKAGYRETGIIRGNMRTFFDDATGTYKTERTEFEVIGAQNIRPETTAPVTRQSTDTPDGEAAMSSQKIPKFNGGHSSKGRGTPSGDGKDLAMRDVADSAIVELANDERSSSRTTLETLGSYRAGSMVVMLARNGELRGIPLRDETIQAITKAHDDGAMFVVGDMPGVDSQFVEFLDKIGADYTIYHAGSSPRFRPQPPDARGDAPSELLARVTDEDAQLNLLYSVPGVAASVRMRSTDGAPVAPGKNAIMKPYLLAPHIDVNGLDASDPAIQSLSPALKAAGLGTYKVTGHSTPKVQGPVVKEFADRLIGPSAVADAVLGTFPTADEMLTIYAVNALIRARAEYLSDSVLNADQVNEAILFGNVMLVGPKLPQDLWDIPQVGTSLYLDPFSYFKNYSNFLKAVIDALPEQVRSRLGGGPDDRDDAQRYWGDTSLFEGIIIREDDDISRRFAPMIRKQAGIVLDHARRHGELTRKWAQTAYDLMKEAGLTDAEVAFVVNEHWTKASTFKLATVQPGNVLGHAARLGVKAFSSRYSPISRAITKRIEAVQSGGLREEEDFGLHEFFHHYLGQGFTRHGEYVAFRGPADLIDSYHGHMQWAWNDTGQLGMFVSRIMTQEFGRGKTDEPEFGYSRTLHDAIGRAIYDRLKEMLSSAEDRRKIMDQVFPEFHGSPSEDEAKIKALIRRQFAGRDLERVRQFADLMPVLRLLTVQDLLVPKMYYPYGGTSKIIGGSN